MQLQIQFHCHPHFHRHLLFPPHWYQGLLDTSPLMQPAIHLVGPLLLFIKHRNRELKYFKYRIETFYTQFQFRFFRPLDSSPPRDDHFTPKCVTSSPLSARPVSPPCQFELAMGRNDRANWQGDEKTGYHRHCLIKIIMDIINQTDFQWCVLIHLSSHRLRSVKSQAF